MSATFAHEVTVVRFDVPDEVGSFHVVDEWLRQRARLVFPELLSRCSKRISQILRD
jgi:hypothetical protein